MNDIVTSQLTQSKNGAKHTPHARTHTVSASPASVPCGMGRFLNADVCTNCTSGKFQNLENQSVCLDCMVNHERVCERSERKERDLICLHVFL